MTETAKYRDLTRPFCLRPDGEPGTVLDVASQGDPVVPWAFSLDLPPDQFARYNSGHAPPNPIQLRGSAEHLPLDDASLDTLYSSHLLEDFEDWMPILREWVRVIKPGGFLVILLPEKERWHAAIRAGQPPNCAHRHEAQVGELSTYAGALNLEVLEDRLTNLDPADYTILFVARKR